MHLLRCHRLIYVQVPQVVTNLIFSYSGRDFAPPLPILRSINSSGVGREVAGEDSGKNVVEYLSLVLVHCYQFPSLAHPWRYAFFDLPLLADNELYELYGFGRLRLSGLEGSTFCLMPVCVKRPRQQHLLRRLAEEKVCFTCNLAVLPPNSLL